MSGTPSGALDAWKKAGSTFSWRGHSIFTRDEGSGPLLLCLHGFPTASWDWHRLWPDLTARFRVVAADMLGFGFSSKPPGHEYSVFEQADLQEDLLRELDVDDAVVLAHDLGDTVAQELLARQLEAEAAPRFRIRGVCLLNGGLFPEQHRPRPIQRLLLSPLGPLIGRLLDRRRFGRSFSAVFGPDTRPTEEELDDFWALVAQGNGPRIAHRLIRYMDERRRHRSRWVDALVETRVPIRLVNGPADPVSGRHVVGRYRELVPDPDVVVLDDRIGHYPQVEDPEATLEAFVDFCDRHGLGSGPE